MHSMQVFFDVLTDDFMALETGESQMNGDEGM